MKEINILSLPKLQYAHSFEAESYKNQARQNPRRIEVSFFVKGEITFDYGQEKLTLKQGDVFCNTCDRAFDVIAEKFHCHHTVSAFMDREYVESGGLLLPSVIYAHQHTENILKLIDGFVYNFDTLKNSPTLAATKFLELLCKIDSIGRKNIYAELPSAQLYTERAKKFVGQNISKAITQTEIAEYLGISSGYLCSVFKEVQGMPLMQYINRQKLLSMRMVMENENVSLQTAAALYGYNDPNYCSRLHKKLFGYNITDKPKWAK